MPLRIVKKEIEAALILADSELERAEINLKDKQEKRRKVLKSLACTHNFEPGHDGFASSGLNFDECVHCHWTHWF